MAVSDHERTDPAADLDVAAPGVPIAARPRSGRSEFAYFALRNWKFDLGLGVVLVCVAAALVGPLLTDHEPLAFTGPTNQPPS